MAKGAEVGLVKNWMTSVTEWTGLKVVELVTTDRDIQARKTVVEKSAVVLMIVKELL